MTIFSAGCSFSDVWVPAHTSFGEIIANKFNQDYDSSAVETAGSNDRIFRVLTQKILDKEITSNDTVLIQYTDTIRREFCSWYKPVGPGFTSDQDAEKWSVYRADGSKKDDKWIVKYFGQGMEILDKTHNKDLLKAIHDYRTWFDSGNHDFYIFNQRHLHFQTFLDYHKITNVYFLLLNFYCDSKIYHNDPLDFIANYRNRVYEDRDIGKMDNEWYLPDDNRHLSQHGHNVLADRIYEWINKGCAE